LKKGAQKFLAMLGHGRCQRQCPWPSINKVLFTSFVHKKKPSPSLAPARFHRSSELDAIRFQVIRL
jgi:hypothetical protein